MIFLSGGAGFVGAQFALDWVAHSDEPLLNLDLLNYAARPQSLAPLRAHPRHHFVQGDIADRALVQSLLQQYRPRAVVHCAAQTHVDRSIHNASDFVLTNVVGSHHLLETVLAYWRTLPVAEQAAFRWLQVSTDEVYGSVAPSQAPCNEQSPYAPRNPYSASKAAADHLALAFFHTHGLPVIVTHACNNYGPKQLPDKLVPLAITRALQGQAIPLYGDGSHQRSWLHVQDHCAGLRAALERGEPGQRYNLGAGAPIANSQLLRQLCAALDSLKPRADGQGYQQQIRLVADRPGHDHRYNIDSSKALRDLGWSAKTALAPGLRDTVLWYLQQTL